MLIGKVAGTVIASQKANELNGFKLLLVEECDPKVTPKGKFIVAVDAVGAGMDEIVLYASGSSARLTQPTQNKPVDAVICGIIDTIELHGDITYKK